MGQDHKIILGAFGLVLVVIGMLGSVVSGFQDAISLAIVFGILAIGGLLLVIYGFFT